MMSGRLHLGNSCALATWGIFCDQISMSHRPLTAPSEGRFGVLLPKKHRLMLP